MSLQGFIHLASLKSESETFISSCIRSLDLLCPLLLSKYIYIYIYIFFFLIEVDWKSNYNEWNITVLVKLHFDYKTHLPILDTSYECKIVPTFFLKVILFEASASSVSGQTHAAAHISECVNVCTEEVTLLVCTQALIRLTCSLKHSMFARSAVTNGTSISNSFSLWTHTSIIQLLRHINGDTAARLGLNVSAETYQDTSLLPLFKLNTYTLPFKNWEQ